MQSVRAHLALVAGAPDWLDAAAVALHVMVHLGARLCSAAARTAFGICLLRFHLGHPCKCQNQLGCLKSVKVQGPAKSMTVWGAASAPLLSVSGFCASPLGTPVCSCILGRWSHQEDASHSTGKRII